LIPIQVPKIKPFFSSVDQYQELVFEGDAIEHIQIFKYFGILLETTSNLGNAVEYLAATGKRSLFVLKRRYAELRIMNIKLRYDLFNTLVRSTANYACEVWVDSKKIKAIEVMYQAFLSPCLRREKAEFRKFPFEHFAWGQALLYYNRVSTVTKDRILGKAWEAQLCLLREKNVGLDP
jgi:hypothetical protein